MTTQTRTGGYLKKMANGGHYQQKLGEASLALTEAYCKADDESRRRMGTHLADQVQHILNDVYGWSHGSAARAADTLREAFTNTVEE